MDAERATLRDRAEDFLNAYRLASNADEEGLARWEDVRAAWDSCDAYADALAEALSALEEPQEDEIAHSAESAEMREVFAWVCPSCKRGYAEPTRCSGPHARPNRKQLHYDFYEAVPVVAEAALAELRQQLVTARQSASLAWGREVGWQHRAESAEAELAEQRISNPREVPAAQALIHRLCELQHAVTEATDANYAHATDCFCGDAGFWPLKRAADFRNEGRAVAFIEEATRDALARRVSGATESRPCPHPSSRGDSA